MIFFQILIWNHVGDKIDQHFDKSPITLVIK